MRADLLNSGDNDRCFFDLVFSPYLRSSYDRPFVRVVQVPFVCCCCCFCYALFAYGIVI